MRVAWHLELPGRGLGDHTGPLDSVQHARMLGLVSSSILLSFTSVLLVVAVFVVVIVVDMSC